MQTTQQAQLQKLIGVHNMSEIRRMRLYRLDISGQSVYVASKEYEHTTLAHERQVADDLAASRYEAGDSYYVAIFNSDNECINKLEIY